MENKRLKLIFFFLLLFLLLGANFVFALEIDYPRVPGATPPQDFIGTAPSEEILSLYVKYIFNLVIWIAGAIAFGAIVMAGMKYLTSAGNPEGMTAARDQISATFFGLLVLLSSFLVLKIINPQFLILKIAVPEIEVPREKIVERPTIESLASSIDAEIPFGRIIGGGIFETYVQPEEQRESGMEKPRMTRLQENSKKTFEIAKALQIQNHRLTELTLGQELGTREKKILVFLSPNKTYLSELYSEEKKQPKVSLTATVLPPSQNASQKATYTFWCHCLYEGVNVDEMKDPKKCGPWDCRVEKGSPLDTSGPQQCTPEIRQIRIPNLSPDNFTAKDLCQYKEPGIYSPKVIVEREGLVNQLRTRVTVIPGLQNQSPQARTGAKELQVKEGETVTLGGFASDPDGDPIALDWSCEDGSLSDPTIANPTFTAPMVVAKTIYLCVFTATDDKNTSTSDYVQITVNPKKEERGCKCSSKAGPFPYCPLRCPIGPDCICDPCVNVRPQIEIVQQQNLQKLKELKEEEEKATNELKLLRIELDKLEKAADFIRRCSAYKSGSIRFLRSLTAFYIRKSEFEAFLKKTGEKIGGVGGIVREIKTWNDVFNKYYDIRKQKAGEDDWAAFYCTIGGTILSTSSPPELEKEPLYGEQIRETGQSCKPEAPVGEIIERAKRIGYTMVERLERLIEFDKKLIEAVEKMHNLVSQCTSQGSPCWSVCNPLYCIPVRCVGPVPEAITVGQIRDIIKKIHKDLAGGDAFEGTKESPGDCWWEEENDNWHFDSECYKKKFKERFNKAVDDLTKNKAPCPYEGGVPLISLQNEKIKKLVWGEEKIQRQIDDRENEGIEDIVKSDKREEANPVSIISELNRTNIANSMGISRIIEEIIPKLIDDLQKKVRYSMETCETEHGEGRLQLCKNSLGQLDPQGKIIEHCCLEEPAFQNCLEKCYLEEKQAKFRNCLQECLNKKAEETGIAHISYCRHMLNNYCCFEK